MTYRAETMRTLLKSGPAVALALLFSISSSVIQAEEKAKIELLLDRSPAPGNAIGYVNVPALNKLMKDAGFSPAAASTVSEVWFLADLDIGSLRPKWEAGYAVLNQPVDAKKLADRLGGYVDNVVNQDVVHAPNQTYFVPGKDHPERLGILRPTDRSLLAGWLTPVIDVKYTPFLSVHAKQPESYLSFMLAIDLNNVLSPIPLKTRLEGLESLKSNSPESVAGTLASIQGCSIIVGRRSLNECIAKFEFSKSPSSLKLIAPELLAEILQRNGTDAPEVKQWEVSVDGNALSLKGPITQSSLSGLMGIFSLQSQAQQAAARASLSEQSEEQRVAYESKHYFDEVNSIIEHTRDHKSQTAGAMAKWSDQRARQIDELGTLNVDPDMIQYGTNVAELLRGNALTVRQTNIDAGKVKASQSLDTGYYNDGYGYYNSNSTSDYQRVTSAIAQGNAYGNYREALNQIDKLTAAMRRDMTQKYKMQF
ncbi:hypothetical protein RBSWK_06468 [Rhodopirellula baltica SWK14]|uniref:Uncharacterized protein n=2 Tax=Rhodopirellula baltica TaxID=265606 RepID=L7C7F7_RHOBT|nr:hypothetical protein RBSWK_06468 [Rhodopirellula baltica SWK14]